jgi:fatty-acyl-CoA synthase
MTGEHDAPTFAIDYSTLKARVTQAANAFHRAGISTGTAVTVLLPNLPQTHYALLGAQAAGIASPVNPMLEVEHIAAIVNETGAQALVACAPIEDSMLWDKAVAVADRCPSVRTLSWPVPRRISPRQRKHDSRRPSNLRQGPTARM